MEEQFPTAVRSESFFVPASLMAEARPLPLPSAEALFGPSHEVRAVDATRCKRKRIAEPLPPKTRRAKSSRLSCPVAEKFLRFAAENGYEQVPTDDEQTRQHVDVEIGKADDRMTRRVKILERKGMSAGDREGQDDFMWICLHGPTPEDDGWLYDDGPEWIAQETASGFLIYDRILLAVAVEGAMESLEPTDCARDAICRPLRYRGRHEVTTLIPAERCVDSEALVHRWDS